MIIKSTRGIPTFTKFNVTNNIRQFLSDHRGIHSLELHSRSKNHRGIPTFTKFNGTNNIRKFISGHRGIIIVSKLRLLYHIWVTIHSLELHSISKNHWGIATYIKFNVKNNICKFISGHRGIIIVSKLRHLYHIWETIHSLELHSRS